MKTKLNYFHDFLSVAILLVYFLSSDHYEKKPKLLFGKGGKGTIDTTLKPLISDLASQKAKASL